MFSTAASNIIAHFIVVKFGFLALFCPALNYPPSLFTNFACMGQARVGVFTVATAWIAAYPVDSYLGHYPGFVQRLFIQRIAIRR